MFNCTADGLPRPVIVWRKNGQLLLNTNTLKIISSDQTIGFRSNIIPEVLQRTSMIEITDLKGNDNGSYSCRADNEANLGVVLTTPFILQVIERKSLAVFEYLLLKISFSSTNQLLFKFSMW